MAGGEVALVLVHGGGHDARCWGPLIDAIARTSDVRTLAVDLPGRGTQPGPLRGLTVGACVDAVVDQIRRAGLERVVLVGHSMAGMIVPGVADALGPVPVERIVLIAANVAPAGRPILDTLPLPSRAMGHLAARWPRPYRLPRPVARALFCNGMSREQARFVTDRLVPEAGWLVREPIPGPRRAAPPATWVLTTKDRAVSPALQRRTIAALDTVDDVVEIDAPHDVMVSDPAPLAAILLARLHPGRTGPDQARPVSDQEDEKVRAAMARVTGFCGCDDLYYCGTSDDIECPRHGGFDVCCAHPEAHLPVGPLSAG